MKDKVLRTNWEMARGPQAVWLTTRGLGFAHLTISIAFFNRISKFKKSPVKCVKQRPHLYANAERGVRKWEKFWCGHVAEAQRTAFVCATNVRWTAEHYPFEVGTSKKNTFTMLGVRLTRWTSKNLLLAFVWVRLSPTCLVRIRIQMWTYLHTGRSCAVRFAWVNLTVRSLTVLVRVSWFISMCSI